MELEKMLRCCECDAKFTAADQLQIHQRRHDMSLNLSKSIAASSSSSSLQTPLMTKGSLSAGIVGFVDETPTPTSFFRNCEEVGLFQDLQNVNPFDEDFKKAASSATATPSGDHPFEFNFSAGVPNTPMIDSALCLRTPRPSKRRYSEQDTLNTPQVFPFPYFSSSTGSCPTLTTNTASMSACLTPTPTPPNSHASTLIPSSPPDALRVQHQPQVETPTISTTYNHEEHVSIIAYTSAISQQTSNKNDPNSGGAKTVSSPKTTSELVKSIYVSISYNGTKKSCPVSQLKIRSKPNLKLDLKNVVPRNKSLTLVEKHSTNVTQSQQTTQQQITDDSGKSDSEQTDKKELLERNRAAAHRSRERRKQWIYGLESRCRALEALLAQSQAEVVRLSSENESLKHQLHDLSKSKEDSQLSPPSSIIVTSSSVIDVGVGQSIMIHQTSNDEVETAVIQEPLVDNVDISSGMVATIVSPIVLPTVKAKRGRPRKGQERRVPILAVSISSSGDVNVAPKIPILRMAQPSKTL